MNVCSIGLHVIMASLVERLELLHTVRQKKTQLQAEEPGASLIAHPECLK